MIGGHALNAHGYFRTTLDVDLLVVDASTFSKLSSNAVTKDFGDTPGKVRRILDLIALTLQALRSAERGCSPSASSSTKVSRNSARSSVAGDP